MIQKIRDYIRQYQIIRPQDHIICGVSGGADSVCLFLVLKQLQEELDFTLEVLHVEHGIRGEESCQDMEFTKELCQQHNVLCTTVRVNVPRYCQEYNLGTEEAARLLRYEAFAARAAKTGGKVALAHHMDDNAETVLFQMLRGSGVRGLSGIAPVRCDGPVVYIRPLLGVSRQEIEEYLREEKQEYCVDSTNTDVTYDRNRLRHQIFPELEKINSQAVAHINQTAGLVSEAWDFISETVEVVKSQVMSQEPDGIYVHIDRLMAQHVAIQKELVLEAIGMAAGRRKDITAVHVLSVLELTNKQSGRRVDLPYTLQACRQYDEIVISKLSAETVKEVCYHISSQQLKACGQRDFELKLKDEKGEKTITFSRKIFMGELDEIPKKAYTKWFDYDKIKGGFSIRKRRPGDYFINDNSGHRKKLKQYFIDEKIPASMRDEIWLMTMESQVIDIIGGRMAEPFKVSKDTREILEVRYDGGK